MTIHVTWAGALAVIGAGALSLFVIRFLYGIMCLWLFARGMKGKNRD